MRLLKARLDGSFTLTKDLITHIPPYAILSHTWGADDEEVSFQDIVNGAGKQKAGFRKIVFCGRQAASDGIEHFWVDTCCIDKSSSAELSEAIISMFRWYRDAKRCYVYLPDVPCDKPHRGVSDSGEVNPDRAWETAFRRSRWFTRGWTLQELLAAPIVHFFSQDELYLGSKTSLQSLIHEITQIPIPCLQEAKFESFTVQERMLWSSGRITSREEDMAYCLQGLLGVTLAPLYGEGKDSAMLRLRQAVAAQSHVDRLPHSIHSERLGSAHTKPVISSPAISTVPMLRDAWFVERPDILNWLQEHTVNPGNRAALVGLGGIGKTQLALHHALQVRERRSETSILWVQANSRSRFEESYQTIADKLRLEGRNDSNKNLLQLVYNWLCEDDNGPWLMVLDNADSEAVLFGESQASESGNGKVLASFLPRTGQGTIIITSRNASVAERLAGFDNVLQVPIMSEVQALSLVYGRLGPCTDENQASELVEALDRIPLAITQAAAFIKRRAPRMSISLYLKTLRSDDEKKTDLLSKDGGDLRRDETASNSVISTWQITFEELDQSAADLLCLMSFFNPHGIPDYVLQFYSDRCKGKADSLEQCGNLDDSLDTLRGYSLIKVSENGNTFEMHPLVQFCSRVWVSSNGDTSSWKHKIFYLLSQLFPSGDPKTWPRCQELNPHVDVVFDIMPMTVEDAVGWVHLTRRVGNYRLKRGRYREAQLVYETIITVMDQVIGPGSAIAESCLMTISSLLRLQGDVQGSQTAMAQLNEYQERYGLANTDTSQMYVIVELQRAGKLEEAESKSRQLLAEWESDPGRDAYMTLESLYVHASILCFLGKYSESEQTLQRVGKYAEVLGPRNPTVLRCAVLRGRALVGLHHFSEAAALLEAAYRASLEAFGSDHPDTRASAEILEKCNSMLLMLREMQ